MITSCPFEMALLTYLPNMVLTRCNTSNILILTKPVFSIILFQCFGYYFNFRKMISHTQLILLTMAIASANSYGIGLRTPDTSNFLAAYLDCPLYDGCFKTLRARELDCSVGYRIYKSNGGTSPSVFENCLNNCADLFLNCLDPCTRLKL